MSYQTKTINAGAVRCKSYYHTWKYQARDGTRRKKTNVTPEAMKKVNEAHAVEKLYFKMCANFTCNDFYLTLKYDGIVNRSVSSQQLKNDKRKFLSALRAAYKKDGKELKFIICYGISKNKVRHMHAVVSCGDIGKIRDCWEKINHSGRITVENLWKNYDYKGLAEYFVKNGKEAIAFDGENFTQLYSCSRNLIKPIEKVKKVTKSSTFRKFKNPKADDGYFIVKDSIESGRDCFGFVYFKYVMIKRE